MPFHKSIESLYPDVTIPQKFDARYCVAYALQSGIYIEMRDWILQSLSLEEKN